MANDIKHAWTNNQIENKKNNVPRTEATLPAHIAGSINGGCNRTVHYAPVMAGQKIKRYPINISWQMLTPLTPAYQRLFVTYRTYFCPNEAAWKNYYKFIAQKGGNSVEKINEMPNFGGKQFPSIQTSDGQAYTSIQNCLFYRDSFTADYLPRLGRKTFFNEKPEDIGTADYYTMPPQTALPLRQRIIIYNELERNKEYDAPLRTFEDFDTVTQEEWEYYMPTNDNSDIWQMRARKPNSYYSDYRTELQGLEADGPNLLPTQNNLMNFAEWQAKIDLARQNAENAQKTDWEIFAEIRGAKRLTEGRPQLIGQVTKELNYSAVVQSAYNNNEQIQDKFQVMGQAGAFSYTNMEVDCFGYTEFIEDGYIHVIAEVWAESVYSSGIDRQLLNVKIEDQYRPEKINEKLDVIYKAEMDNSQDWTVGSLNMDPVGYKRRFNELFKLPNLVKGDMLPQGYHVENENGLPIHNYNQYVEPNDTYQFFENSIYKETILNMEGKAQIVSKAIWKDYTDLLINKNLAIKNRAYIHFNGAGEPDDIRLTGQNQLFYVGYVNAEVELPVDPSIQSNYTEWGEE